jgi:hypothetical protein
MTEKQILTDREIVKDIANAIRYPAEMTEDSYNGWTPIAVVLAGVAVVLTLVKPMLYAQIMLGSMAAVIVWLIARHLYLRHRARRISLEDYEITVEILHSKDHERYFMSGYGRSGHGKKVYNYTWRFENGQSWRLPQKVYLWSDLYSLASARVHESIHRGDSILVVTKKDGGDVMAAYPMGMFEYRKKSIHE